MNNNSDKSTSSSTNFKTCDSKCNYPRENTSLTPWRRLSNMTPRILNYKMPPCDLAPSTWQCGFLHVCWIHRPLKYFRFCGTYLAKEIVLLKGGAKRWLDGFDWCNSRVGIYHRRILFVNDPTSYQWFFSIQQSHSTSIGSTKTLPLNHRTPRT